MVLHYGSGQRLEDVGLSMERSRVPLQRLSRKSTAASLPVMTRSRISSKRSGKLSIGSAYSAYQDNFIGPRKKSQQTVSLPIVTGASMKEDKSFEDDDKEHREPTPEAPGSDVVIVQLFTERCYNNQRESSNNLLEPPRSYALSSPAQQQRVKSQRKYSKPLTENLLEVSSTRTVAHMVESRNRHRPEVNALSGFTQTELRIHTDREKQKSTIYLLNEQEQSKRIVQDWLKTLPNEN